MGWILAFALLGAPIAYGCGPQHPNCENEDHCHDDEHCVMGHCQECRHANDCSSSQRCVQGRCE